MDVVRGVHLDVPGRNEGRVDGVREEGGQNSMERSNQEEEEA